MNKKILLLDGHSIANRAFYGIPLLTNQEGIYTNAVYGFLNIMLSMIEKEKPDLLGVCFDVNKPTFRHLHTESYKGTRKGMPAELRPQIPIIKKVLEAMGIQMMEKEGFEADDLLGTLAKTFEKESYHVVIVSGDRDLLQVTTDLIEIKIPKTKQTGTEIESYFAKDVMAKYDVTPQEFIDVKGLMGDASDNIKGVPGVGEKTAIKLIKQYGSIEGIYEHIDEITQKKLKENLTTYEDQALESKMLATIVCDVPLDLSETAFDYTLALSEDAVALFKELEFKKLITKLQKDHGGSTVEAPVPLNLTEASLEEVLTKHGSQQAGYSYFYAEDKLALGLICEGLSAYQVFDLTTPKAQETVGALFSTDRKSVV